MAELRGALDPMEQCDDLDVSLHDGMYICLCMHVLPYSPMYDGAFLIGNFHSSLQQDTHNSTVHPILSIMMFHT